YDGSLMLRVFHQLLVGRNREILSEAQSVVANSAALRALALQSFPDQRIDVVTNGVCTRDYRPAKPLRRAGALQVICVARRIKRKGLEDALHALAATTSRAVQLHLVGLGPQMHSMARLASELGVAGQVVFRGHLIGDDLARAYREADAFLLP